MLSPKKITQFGVWVGLISVVGIIPTIFLNLGTLNWWPAVGIGLALILFVLAFARGAYLTAQKRVDMVDMLNDCYQGNSESGVGR